MQDFDLARDLTLFARVLRRAEGGRRVVLIFAVSIAVTVANMFGQVRLNEDSSMIFGRSFSSLPFCWRSRSRKPFFRKA